MYVQTTINLNNSPQLYELIFGVFILILKKSHVCYVGIECHVNKYCHLNVKFLKIGLKDMNMLRENLYMIKVWFDEWIEFVDEVALYTI
jgi:hypothetical protein